MSVATARVSELAQQVRGVTYSADQALAQCAPGFLPILRANNITETGPSFQDLVYVPAKVVGSQQLLRANDVLIATSSGSISVVGKAVRIAEDFDGGFGAFCKVLRPSAGVDPAYFAHFFKTQDYRRRVSALAAGANINNLRNEHLDGFEIALPPLPEQRRIADILDRAETLRAQRRQALAQLDTLAEAIFLEMFGDPRRNSKRLAAESLGRLVRLKSGEFLPASDMASSGAFAVYGGNGVNGKHDRFLFDERKIVIGRVGAYCGCVHVSPRKSWITDNALYVSEMSASVEFDYLVEALRFAKLNDYASQSGQPLVSASRLYPVQVLVPPLAQQGVFVERLAALGAIARPLRASAEALGSLFASLQHRAFRGEL